jgi:GAF domain-containing protein/class 3 adenylate cyclase/anti-sigma regulatory factor (Ser/Thr protein kinase)
MQNDHQNPAPKSIGDKVMNNAFLDEYFRSNNIHDLVRLTTYLRRYVSPLVVADLVRNDQLDLLLQQTEVDAVTALIVDIRGFVRTTQFSEQHGYGLDSVAHLLRVFFSRIIEVAFENYGLVGEFAGDRVLITFGFPDTDSGSAMTGSLHAIDVQAFRAVRTAFAILELSEQIRMDSRFPPAARRFEVGIGICGGRRAWIGDIGSNHNTDALPVWRQELTVISAGVNIAARAEELTKNDQLLAISPTRKIIVDEVVHDSLVQRLQPDHYLMTDLGALNVRGLDERVRLFHLRDVNSTVIDLSQAISEHDRKLVERICAYIDGAIERNATVKIHRALAEVGNQIVSGVELHSETVFEQIIEQVQLSFHAHKATLYQYDLQTGELIVLASIGPRPLPPNSRLPRGRGIAGRVAESGEAYLTGNVHQDEHWRGAMHDPEIHSMVCVPLILRHQTVGVLQIMDEQEGRYDDADLDALQVFARLAAVALQNAHHYAEELRLARGRNIITQAFAGAQSLDEVLTAVMEAVAETLTAQNATLYLIDQETGELMFEKIVSESAFPPTRGTRLPKGTGIVGWVVAHKEARLIRDTRTDPDWYGRIGTDMRSIICTPLVARGVVFGVIQVLDKRSNAFDEADLQILNWLAASAAIAVNNAVQLNQARRKLIASEAIAGLGAISGKLAHNLKNQVGAIKTIAAFQLKSDDPRMQRKIQQIVAAADEALAEVRSFMQPLTGWSPTTVSLAAVLQHLVTQLTPEMIERADPILGRSRIELVLQLAEQADQCDIYAGLEQIEYILRNLIDNAQRAIDEAQREQGLIEIQLRRELINDVGWALLEVKDNGIGIPPDSLDKVFELSYTTRPEGSIGGYGLFWVRLNVERLGGRISAVSAHSQGTTFQVRLPLSFEEEV